MNNKTEKVCRLCLETSNEDFEVIENITKEMLDSLPLKIDLSISKDPLICNDCSENLQKSFYLTSNVINGAVNLNEHTVDDNTGYVFCQFCVQYIKRDKCRSLDKLKRDGSLTKYIPDMDPNISLVCIVCLVSLENCIRFFTNCWNVEEKIKALYKARDINNGRVELNDLVQLILADMLKSNDISQTEYKVMKNVSFTKENNQENSPLKQESLIKPEVDIKTDTEEVISKRPPDYKMLYYCPNCTYELKPVPNLRCHSLTHRCNSVKPDPQITVYVCDECPYESGEIVQLIKHLLTHSTSLTEAHSDLPEGTIYSCEICDFKTKDKPHLRFHKLAHNHSLKVPMYKCKRCEYQTRGSAYIKHHVTTHSRKKCDVCGLMIYLTDLEAHTSTHDKFQCGLCTFTAKEKDELLSHMSTHDCKSRKSQTTGEVYKCNKCPVTMNNRSNLQRHLLVHKSPSELRMYKCEWCSYQAKRMYQLRTHLLIHKDPSEITWYKCGVCNYKNKVKYGLKRHMTKHARQGSKV